MDARPRQTHKNIELKGRHRIQTGGIMAENEVELQSYAEDLRCRDQEIAAMNRDHNHAMKDWVNEHNH